MSAPSRTVQIIVWGGLAAVVLAVAAAWFLQPPAQPLPVYGDVPDFSLSNQDGRTVTRADWRGHIVIVDLIFSRCASTCPLMSATMKQLQNALPAASPVSLVSLTCDPAYDTPGILKTYGARYDARNDVWSFLTGPKKALYHLAVDGLKLTALAKTPSEQDNADDLFMHSTKLVLVDQQGRIRGYFDGETSECLAPVLAAVKQLAREK